MEVKALALQAFLQGFEGVPVTWGRDDCSAVFAPWLARRGVMVELPRYSDRASAHAIIAENGGLVATWDRVLGGALPERYGDAELGDIAVIDSRLHGPVGVICAASNIAAWRRNEGGFFVLTVRRFIKTWAVP